MLSLSDNVEARQWLNATLLSLVQYGADGSVEVGSVIPFIDGGTEGFGGQARVFLPGLTSCFECSLASMPPPVGFPTCTIRHVPRLPEHCIVYALKVEWPLLTSFTSASDFSLYERCGADDEHTPAAVQLDKDDAQHLSWICNRAQARAAAFGITGVTFALTMQVVKASASSPSTARLRSSLPRCPSPFLSLLSCCRRSQAHRLLSAASCCLLLDDCPAAH